MKTYTSETLPSDVKTLCCGCEIFVSLESWDYKAHRLPHVLLEAQSLLKGLKDEKKQHKTHGTLRKEDRK